MPSNFFSAKNSYSRYTQVLFVLIAFALMVISSYIYVSRMERNHLLRYADSTIMHTESNIKSDMLEPETLLGGVSETISLMIINGETKEDINEYLAFVNDYVWDSSDGRLLGATGFFGVFDVFGDIMLIGQDTWDYPDNYDYKNRSWYMGAVNEAGAIYTSDPYLNLYSNEMTITMSRRIFNREKEPVGIICLNIELERITRHAVETGFVEGGYGFLLSQNLIIIAHPDRALIGQKYEDIRDEVPAYIEEFTRKGSISEEITYDYRGIKSIVFIHRLYNGWFMGIVAPRDNYYQSTRILAIILSLLGAIFAGLLIWMLLEISKEKANADERMKVMFDATPLSANFWNKDMAVIDCNRNAVDMFELSSKEEYCRRFFDLSPEFQPDGSLSAVKAVECVKRALNVGVCRFEWMHQKLNGEPIPCEVSLVRVVYRNDPIVIGYSRDLREHQKILQVSEQQARLLDTVNTAATILLSSGDMDSFESLLIKCFDLIGHCLDADRVQIWRNEVIDDELYFVMRYEWLSEFGKNCKSIPVGLHFPYSMKKEWYHLFLHSGFINSPIAQLAEEDKSFLGYYEMKSIVFIPLFLGNEFWGLFSINDCRNERKFSPEQISILTSAGLMMSSAINRNIQAIKVREAEERTQIMLDSAPLCIVFWDNELNLIDCNQEAVKLFGFSGKQEFIDHFVLLSPEFQADGRSSKEAGGYYIKKAFEEGFSRFEWMHQKLDGEEIPADVTCIRVKHKEKFTVTEYIRDLREQKAMFAEMRKAEIAEESSKAKSDFLAKMSHEIRTPMNAILGITEIQLQDDTHPQVTREAFERIYNSGDLLLGIINDILDLSKIEAGKLVLSPSQYDIASLVHDTVQLNIMRYESKPIEFSLDINENIPMFFIGDELRIKQILNNLLSNAFKYTNEGNVNLKVDIEELSPAPEAQDSWLINLVFTIKDTGQGLTQEQVKKLGTEYMRFNTEANRMTEGTGLGMNITQNLIYLMNGSLSIESEPGRGSTFTVRLPQESADSSILGKDLADNLMQLNLENTLKIKTTQVRRDFMPYGRVLVVDDVETNLYVARGLLAPYGLSIETASSGFEAIDKIREGSSFDIVFMDHMMPRMDGIEAVKIIRSLGYSKPIVALTANALAGQAQIFLDNGFDDFISKPIDIRSLNMILNKLVRDVHPPEVVEAARKQKNELFFSSERKKDIAMQLAEVFIRDAKKIIPVLQAVYSQNFRRSDDLANFIVNIHAMKSALANIGNRNLSDLAAKLEQAGREQNIKLIIQEFPSFLDILNGVIDDLEKKTEGESGAVLEDDRNFLIEKLSAVKDACSALDKKTAKKTLEELRQKSWSADIKKMLSGLSETLLHSDFDETVKIINDFIK